MLNGSQEYQSGTKPTANTRLAANQTRRNHHFISTKTMMILQNMRKKEVKLKKKNIPKRNKMDIHQIDIVN